MLKLNAVQLLEGKKLSKYKLFNKLNTIRASKGEPLMNYTNFLHMITLVAVCPCCLIFCCLSLSISTCISLAFC